ncbi:MAG: hypothetical protein U0694_09095 [Anaerolineae bacterium]
MAVVTPYRYRVIHGEHPIETYTQEEAIAIAQRLALEANGNHPCTGQRGQD